MKLNKKGITGEVFNILKFQADCLGIDLVNLDKNTRDLVVTAFVEGFKYAWIKKGIEDFNEDRKRGE